MIVFRADGNGEIGSGHIMRCLSIAEEARERGACCRFLLADGSMAGAIEGRGFACDILHTHYRRMDAERGLLEPLLQQYRPKAIVVDSYFVTAGYLAWLGRFGDVTYIDDLAAFAYPAKRVVNYNIYGPGLNYEGLYKRAGVAKPRLLLGPQYAPLRRQFQNSPLREQPQIVRSILVSTGGADPQHIALQLAGQLAACPSGGGYEYHFILGAMNPDAGRLKEAAQACGGRVILHQNVQDMAGLMRQCDLAVSAAGSTLYELCACGVPTVTYAVADNQLLGMDAFEKQGVMVSTGDVRALGKPAEALIARAEEVAQDYKKRKSLAKKMQRLVDGNGAGRIAGQIK